MNTLTWQKSFPEMETAQILLKLAGFAWLSGGGFQSEKVIMAKCQDNESRCLPKYPRTCF